MKSSIKQPACWEINKNDFYNITQESEKIEFLLNFATLAPSTHNSQPWLFKVTKNLCEININLNKKLPEADPKLRDIYISLGCAVENLRIASSYYNVLDTYRLIDNAMESSVALFNFHLDSKNTINSSYENLITSILKRVNARGIFLKKDIPKETIDRIKNITLPEGIELKILDDKSIINKIANLTADGIRIAYERKAFRKEAANWINNFLSSKKYGIPSYALKIPSLISLIFPFILKKINLGKQLSRLNFNSVNSAASIFVFSCTEEKKINWLKIGMIAERMMLELNAMDINTSIYVASIEMGDLQKKLKKITNDDKLPQFLFCAGYLEEKFKHTPRIEVKELIIKN